jgi:hypothetical protein
VPLTALVAIAPPTLNVSMPLVMFPSPSNFSCPAMPLFPSPEKVCPENS